jgi:hypothetical protein
MYPTVNNYGKLSFVKMINISCDFKNPYQSQTYNVTECLLLRECRKQKMSDLFHYIPLVPEVNICPNAHVSATFLYTHPTVNNYGKLSFVKMINISCLFSATKCIRKIRNKIFNLSLPFFSTKKK